MLRKLLESLGHTIFFKSIRTQWNKVDLGVMLAGKSDKTQAQFDIVSWKDGIWYFWSVKASECNGNYLGEQKKIDDFKKKYGLPKMMFTLAIWHKPRWRGAGKNKFWQAAHWSFWGDCELKPEEAVKPEEVPPN